MMLRTSDYSSKIVHTAHIVNYFWPKADGKNVGKIPVKTESEFLESMRKCSIEQIKFYWNTFDEAQTARAIWTLKQLERNNTESVAEKC